MSRLLFLSLLALLLSLSHSQNIQSSRSACLSQPRLICTLTPTTGNTVRGRVIFSPVWRTGRPVRKCLVRVAASVSGLSPGGHGFHIHTYGDLTTRDGTSAGGHFTTPGGAEVPHGFPFSAVRHWGDFGSVVADADGKASYTRVDKIISFRGIVGRGMIVHELRDMGPDFQPTGGAGARQAACVIGFANPELL